METIFVSEPWEIVAVDVMGPLPRTAKGNRFIVVFSDYFTRWVEAFAITVQDTKHIAKLLVEQIICRYGTPKKLLSDRGSVFLSDLAKQVYEALGIHKLNTTAYHPQTDGLVERFNHTLATMLAMFCNDNQRDWDVLLPYVLFAYRTTLEENLVYQSNSSMAL